MKPKGGAELHAALFISFALIVLIFALSAYITDNAEESEAGSTYTYCISSSGPTSVPSGKGYGTTEKPFGSIGCMDAYNAQVGKQYKSGDTVKIVFMSEEITETGPVTLTGGVTYSFEPYMSIRSMEWTINASSGSYFFDARSSGTITISGTITLTNTGTSGKYIINPNSGATLNIGEDTKLYLVSKNTTTNYINTSFGAKNVYISRGYWETTKNISLKNCYLYGTLTTTNTITADHIDVEGTFIVKNGGKVIVNDFYVHGNLTVTGSSSSVTANASVTAVNSKISIDNSATFLVKGDLKLDRGTSMVATSATVQGRINTTAGTSLTAKGAITANNGMRLYGTLEVPENCNTTLAVNNGATIETFNTFDVKGTAKLNGDTIIQEGASSKLTAYNKGTITVNGNLTVNGTSDIQSGSTFTLGSGKTLRVSGSAMFGGDVNVMNGQTITVENRGNFNMNGNLYVAGTLSIDEDSMFALGSGKILTITGSATFRCGLTISNSSKLAVQNGASFNLGSDKALTVSGSNSEAAFGIDIVDGQKIIVENGGKLKINDDVILSGSINVDENSALSLEAGKNLTIAGSVATNSDILVQNGSMLIVENGGNLTVNGDITVNGTFDLKTGSTLALGSDKMLKLSSGSIVTFAIDMTLSEGQSLIIENGGKLTTNGSFVVTDAGALDIQEGSEFVANGTLDLENDIAVNGSLTSGGGSSFILGADKTLTISGSGSEVTLDCEANVPSGSTFVIENGGKLIAKNNFTTFGVLSVDEDSTFSIDSGKNLTISGSGSEATFEGELTIPSGSTLTVESEGVLTAESVIVYGAFKVSDTDASSIKNVTITGSDAIVEYSVPVTVSEGSEYKVEEGTFIANEAVSVDGDMTVLDGGTLSANGSVVVSGRLVVSDNAKLEAKGAFEVCGGELDVSGTAEFTERVSIGGATTVESRTLASSAEIVDGVATISGNVMFDKAVSVFPGSSFNVEGGADLIAKAAFSVQGTLTVSDSAGSFTFKEIFIGMNYNYIRDASRTSASVDLGSGASEDSFTCVMVCKGSAFSYGSGSIRAKSTQFVDDLDGGNKLCFTGYAGNNASTLISSANGSDFNKSFGRWYDLNGESTSVTVGKLSVVYMAPAGTSDVVITPSKGFKTVTIGDETWDAEVGVSHSFYVYPGENAVLCKLKSGYSGKIKLTDSDTGIRLSSNKIIADVGQTYRYDASVSMFIDDDDDDWIPSEESGGIDMTVIIAVAVAIIMLLAMMMIMEQNSKKASVTFYASVGGTVSNHTIKVPSGTVMTFRGRNAILHMDNKEELTMVTAKPNAEHRFASWNIYDDGTGSWRQGDKDTYEYGETFVILGKTEIDVMFLEGKNDGVRDTSKNDDNRVTIIKGSRDPSAMSEFYEDRIQDLD